MTLNQNWIKFNATNRERGFNRLHVTINHKGQIHIGRKVHVDLGRPRAVTLYYEPKLEKIALEPCDPRSAGAIPLVEKTYGAYYIPAHDLCRTHRVAITGTRAFLAPEINHNGVLILSLGETVAVGRGRRMGPEDEDRSNNGV